MDRRSRWIVSVFTVLGLVSLHSLAFAIYEFCGVNHRFSLQGLEGVQVKVVIDYEIGSELPALSDPHHLRQLTTGVEEKLRMAGIKVLGQYESGITPARPLLLIWASILKVKPNKVGLPPYRVFFDADLYQNVNLERRSAVGPFFVSTWALNTMCRFGEVPVNEFQKLRYSVRLIADQFIKAYRSVNPK
jgi:hypothetical protein